MAKKDYIRLAEALRDARDESGTNSNHNGGIDAAARHIARALASDNSRFDLDRFMAAAGGK